MPLVKYQDLKYSRENGFYDKLFPTYQKIIEDHPGLKKEFSFREDKFYHLISNALQVDEHYVVKNITRQINRHLKTNFKIRVYVFQADRFHAYCTPRIDYNSNENEEELIILVSQHFFNSLGEYERVSIIAHELAHMVYGHVHIPVDLLLKKNFDLDYIESFKSDLLKWSLCREISADIFSLVASDFNDVIVSRSLIKFATGLDDVYGDDMIRMALKQFDQIADAAYQKEVSTHPLMPLRIKVINAVSETNLVRKYGKNVSKAAQEAYINEFNCCIDDIMEKIYPELVSENIFFGNEILFNMSVAVALSDGHISNEELRIVGEMSKSTFNYKSMLQDIESSVIVGKHAEMVNKLIDRSVQETKEEGYTKTELIPLIRQLIIIAASDGNIDSEELETIIDYAKEFGFTRMDIIIALSSLGF
jgi:tellurite resistance protein